MLSTSEPVASTSAKDSDGVLSERLESMKRIRSCLIRHVTKFQSELEGLMVDSSQYEAASKKKVEPDEAMSRCLEHYCSYLNSVPDKADYKEQWLEARNKYSDLQKRKIVHEDNFQEYVQHCTDGDPSVSQIDDKSSKVSSTSS